MNKSMKIGGDYFTLTYQIISKPRNYLISGYFRSINTTVSTCCVQGNISAAEKTEITARNDARTKLSELFPVV